MNELTEEQMRFIRKKGDELIKMAIHALHTHGLTHSQEITKSYFGILLATLMVDMSAKSTDIETCRDGIMELNRRMITAFREQSSC